MDLDIVKLTVCLFCSLSAIHGNKREFPKRVIWVVCVGKLKKWLVMSTVWTPHVWVDTSNLVQEIYFRYLPGVYRIQPESEQCHSSNIIFSKTIPEPHHFGIFQHTERNSWKYLIIRIKKTAIEQCKILFNSISNYYYFKLVLILCAISRYFLFKIWWMPKFQRK